LTLRTHEELAEIEAIKQLKARYFRFMDTKNWAEWRKVFTDDVVVRVDVTVSAKGKEAAAAPLEEGGDAFVANISRHLADVRTVHHGHMPEIALTGSDTATGVWSMEDIVEMPDGRTLRGYGHYHERYRKQDGQWRIARLHLTRLRLDYTGPWSRAELEALEA
jgi:hypothetical protein